MRKRKEHPHGHPYKFILMVLLKEGPLSSKELEHKTLLFVSQFYIVGYHLEKEIEKKVYRLLSRFGYQPEEGYSEEREKSLDALEEELNVEFECNNLIEKGLLRLNEENKYELSEKGEAEAILCTNEIEKVASSIKGQLLSTSAAARNTIIADFFLAVMKLLAGFLSGSVGLIADGADAAVDTASASIVWIGIKLKKELLGTLIIILMMFVTAVSVGFESITKIIQAITATITPISMPFLVITVEGIALITAGILSLYQRYVGKREGSLALISQSVDSKNHIYVAAAVIIGAIFSVLGVHFVDALIGAVIGARIFIDGISLSKEAISSIKGRETDFSKYGLPLEEQWQLSKLEAFRSWILYSVKEDKLHTKDELVSALERTFRPKYIPILSESKLSLGEGFDFEAEFDDLIEPLLTEKLLIKEPDKYILTKEGKKCVDRIFNGMRYRQNK